MTTKTNTGNTALTPISLAAAEARVRRALAKEDRTLHISRGERDRQYFGASYITNANNVVVASSCTIEGLADELGVIAPGETIAQEASRG